MDKSIVTLVSDVQIERAREAHMFHELANVSTLGFKRAFEQFNVAGDGTDNALGTTLVEMKEGPKIYTGNPLDVYLNNDTVLGAINDQGQVNFTRRGDLKINTENQLTLGSGKLVAADGGDPIVILAGLVEHLRAQLGGQQGNGCRQQFVQRLGTQAAAQHQQARADPLAVSQFALNACDGRRNGGRAGLADQVGQDLQHADS